MKLSYYRSLENNRSRADKYVNAFINGIDWAQEVGAIDRISKITKPQLVAFANRFFTPGYVAIYKKQGIDTNQKKIDKPAITPIPTNRDQMSQFVKDIQNAKVEPIQPRFVDFKNDLTISETKRKLPLLYVKNNSNGLFNLTFRYEFGQEDDNRYGVAAQYIDYLGTKKMTLSQIKQKFYQLACNYSISVGSDAINVSLSGLSENMPEALALLEDLMQNAKVDNEAYGKLTDLILKDRNDAKKDQRACFQHAL